MTQLPLQERFEFSQKIISAVMKLEKYENSNVKKTKENEEEERKKKGRRGSAKKRVSREGHQSPGRKSVMKLRLGGSR